MPSMLVKPIQEGSMHALLYLELDADGEVNKKQLLWFETMSTIKYVTRIACFIVS